MSACASGVFIAFRVSALPSGPFEPLFGLSDDELAGRGVRRVVADAKPGYPCRVSLADADPGETLLLLHHVHHDVLTPYRSAGPIYVRERAAMVTPGPASSDAGAPGEVPELVRGRLLSLRAYDRAGELRDADVIEGRALEPVLERLFADPDVAYLHVHNARPGCYSCRVDRAPA